MEYFKILILKIFWKIFTPKITVLNVKYNTLWCEGMGIISFFCRLMFFRYLVFVQQGCNKLNNKLQTKLKFLTHKRYGCTVETNVTDINFNYYSHELNHLSLNTVWNSVFHLWCLIRRRYFRIRGFVYLINKNFTNFLG